MAKTNQQKPAFSVGGAFQALSVDHVQSSSEEEEEQEHEGGGGGGEEIPQPTRKKKKQRAKERAKKINQIPTTTTTTTKKTEKKLPIEKKPVPVPEKIQLPVPVPEKITEEKLPEINPTSPTTSTVNSISTTPSSSSTTDLDEEEDDEPEESYDLNQQPLITNKGTAQDQDKKDDTYPESPATARPFAATQSFPPQGHHHLTTTPTQSDTQISQFGADHTPGKKWQTVLTRVIWSLVMVTGFITLMALGHVYLIILVFIIQLLVFREVTNLFQVGYKASAKNQLQQQQQQQQQVDHHNHPIVSISPSTSTTTTTHHHSHSHQVSVKEKKRIKDVGDKNRTNKIMSWYFFGVANYFLYGESIIYYFKHVTWIKDEWYLIEFGRHHRFISLLLYLIGFLGFVKNLDRGHLRRQFGLFSWIHMSLLLIIVFGQFMVNNILEGLIWFWVPASLVIMNDVAAYVFGMLFGKHQLIKLSPKKTVEGFVGGFFMTVIFGVLWGSLFMGWNYMICPVQDLSMTAFTEVRCDPNPVFKWRSVGIGEELIERTRGLDPIISSIVETILSNRFIPKQIWWTPFQLHCLVLATFAGLVAPFGGFFASGFKRAFNVKDFGHTIPGHGGLTDRFDCQFIMGLFTYFYYSSLVKEEEDYYKIRNLKHIYKFDDINSIFNFLINNHNKTSTTSGGGFNDDQLLTLYNYLKNYLVSKGLLLL